MPFIKSKLISCDIFLSYARNDNITPESDGWITLFKKSLEKALDEKTSEMGKDKVEIWWDPWLEGNKIVDDVIEDNIRKSALFIAVTSQEFLKHGCYCLKELDWFVEAAEQSRPGPAPGGRARILNVRRQDIPAGKWPEAFKGKVGYEFFKKARNKPEGITLVPGTDEFKKQTGKLADEIIQSLLNIQQVLDKRQVKILSLTASPESDVFYELAQETLISSFSGYKENEVFIDMPDPVDSTLEELKERCSAYSYDILILFCHGSGEGFLLLEDKKGGKIPVQGKELARSLAGLTHQPSIIILSACHSAAPEGRAKLTNLLSPAKELSTGLDVPCIIGMNKEISQFAAIDFNTGFIQVLLHDGTIEQAYEAGIDAIKQGEAARLKDKALNWHFINEETIPVVRYNNNGVALTRTHFHDGFIPSPEIDSTNFENAAYLERGFVGRRKELREMYQLLDNEKPGVILVKGPGGMGKSTYMTRVCAGLIQKGYTLLIFIGLIRISGVMERLFRKAGEMGYPGIAALEEDACPWEERFLKLISGFLLKEKIIIFFDNFEDNQDVKTGKITDDSVSIFIRLCNKHLAGKNPGLLITGRYSIPYGVKTIELPAMTPVENRKLFMFKPTLKQLKDREIRDIHSGIGGNPRAIEVLETLSREEFGREGLEDLAEKEEKKALFHELIGDMKKIMTGSEKTDTFDFAPQYLEKLVGTLTGEEKTLLKGIALYRTPVHRDAPGITGIPNIRTVRKRLVDLSLAMYIPVETYYTYRLISDYVATHLYEPEELKTLRTKAGAFLEEKGSYFEALYQYKEAGEWDKAFEVADPLQGWLWNHGYVYEAREVLEGIAVGDLNRRNQANYLHAYGIIEQSQGKVDSAMSCYEKSVKIEEELGNKAGIATSYHQIGNVHYQKGEYNTAKRYYNKSLQINKELGNKTVIALNYHQIGIIHQDKGEYEAAIEYYNRSLQIAEELGNKVGIANIYHEIGIAHQDKGEYDTAVDYYNRSLRIQEKLGNKNGISNSYHQIGIIHQYKGDYEAANACYNSSLQINEELGNKAGIALNYYQIGIIHQDKGEYDTAIDYCNRSLRIQEELGNKTGIALNYHQIGIIHQDKGEYDAAIDYYNRSLRITEKLGNKACIACSYHQIGKIYHDKGEYKAAIDYYNRSLRIEKELGNKTRIAIGYHQIGRIHQDKEEYDAAIDNYNKSLWMDKELGNKSGIAANYGQLGRIALDTHDYTGALEYFIRVYCLFRTLQNPYVKLAGKYILQTKLHLPPEEYTRKLREAGIAEEELGQAQGEENHLARVLQELSRQALSGNPGIAVTIDTFLGQFPEEMKAGEQGKVVLRYLGFLKELAGAEDKEAFLAGADEEMVGVLRQLTGESAGKGDEAASADESLLQVLARLTEQALSGEPDVVKAIDTLCEQLPEEMKAGEQGKVVLRYLGFLKELAGAEDKEAFLAGADEEMVGVMRQLLEGRGGE